VFYFVFTIYSLYPKFYSHSSASEVSKTIGRLNQTLEGLIRLRKAVISMLSAYYSKRIQSKVMKGKGTQDEAQWGYTELL
jgi:hypothetical protein